MKRLAAQFEKLFYPVLQSGHENHKQNILNTILPITFTDVTFSGHTNLACAQV